MTAGHRTGLDGIVKVSYQLPHAITGRLHIAVIVSTSGPGAVPNLNSKIRLQGKGQSPTSAAFLLQTVRQSPIAAVRFLLIRGIQTIFDVAAQTGSWWNEKYKTTQNPQTLEQKEKISPLINRSVDRLMDQSSDELIIHSLIHPLVR